MVSKEPSSDWLRFDFHQGCWNFSHYCLEWYWATLPRDNTVMLSRAKVRNTWNFSLTLHLYFSEVVLNIDAFTPVVLLLTRKVWTASRTEHFCRLLCITWNEHWHIIRHHIKWTLIFWILYDELRIVVVTEYLWNKWCWCSDTWTGCSVICYMAVDISWWT